MIQKFDFKMKWSGVQIWNAFISMLAATNANNIPVKFISPPPHHVIPLDDANVIPLWQTKSEWGDGGYPFKWRKHKPLLHKIKYKQDGILFATYNCWRSSINIRNRCRYLIQSILRSPADIICLQETSPLIVRELVGEFGIMDKFIFSDISGQYIYHKNGQLMLFRRKHIRIYSAFKVNVEGQDCQVQCALVNWAHKMSGAHYSLLIHVRFSAGTNKPIVFQKINDMIDQMEWQYEIVMMGDMSLNDEDENQTEIFSLYGWQDAAINCNMDTIGTSSGLDPDLPHRPDRILFKTSPSFSSKFKPIGLTVFAKENIHGRRSNLPTFASTHFGVAAHFVHT